MQRLALQQQIDEKRRKKEAEVAKRKAEEEQEVGRSTDAGMRACVPS
jgi:hypothetical protein